MSLDIYNGSSVNQGTFQGEGKVRIPFSADTFDIEFYLNSFAGCHLGCIAFSNFSNTATVGGARILDTSGNVVPGAFLTTQSGYDYITPPREAPESTSPEPASAILSAGALAVLLCWHKCRK